MTEAMGQEALAIITSQDLANRVRIPGSHDRVFNEECIFSFDSPESKEGLYVCMEKFLGLGRDFVERYHARTGNCVFLRIKRQKVPKEVPQDSAVESCEEGVPEKVSRLAIGLPGGFNVDEKKFDIVENLSIVILPGFKEVALDNASIPIAIQMSAKAILKADSAVKKEELEQAAGTWDGEQLFPSKYAESLVQHDNGKKIQSRGWQCEKCDLTNNLWLNLTDGSIMCGRKFFDGTGGNNHAVDYFKEKGYPLAVKLGTITADGKADVFSYPEDTMVEDPHLVKHLSHFGINIQSLTKSDKSMVELEIEVNQRYGEWAALTEAASKLQPMYGPGYTGMENLGNTCYMNSLMQVLFSLPPFIKQYVTDAPAVFSKINFNDPMNDFKLQMCKLGSALWSDSYSRPLTEEEQKIYGSESFPGVRPVIFKHLVGKGHVEFSTKRQQDVQEFFLHLCQLMERYHTGEANPSECFQFEVEDRIECGTSSQVRYTTRVEDYIPLPIPLSAAVNQEAVQNYEMLKTTVEAMGQKVPDEEKVRPVIPFEACIQAFIQEEEVADFYSSAIKSKTFAKKLMRMKTFPDYLCIQLKKFGIDENNWSQPYKLDVEVLMPDEFDLACLAAKGLQPGETELPNEPENPTASSQAPSIIPDPNIVEQLLQMGFGVDGCKRAAFQTKNAGIEAALNWVMEHSADSDFDHPFVQPGPAGQAAAFVPDEGALSSLMDMGVATRRKAVKALKCTQNNVERAVDWIFSHPDDDGDDEGNGDGTAPAASASSSSKRLTNGSPKYSLLAFISHMGTSTMCGHYVCHIKRDGKWVIFNDSKVALSEKPPKGLGYIYIYKRSNL